MIVNKTTNVDRAEIKQVLQGLSADIEQTSDKNVAKIFNALVNLVEVLLEQDLQSKKTIQALRNEVNHLKGEQGKPNIRPQTKPGDTNHSSEDERKKREAKTQRKAKVKKKKSVKIDRFETCKIDPSKLPVDAIFKGYETRVIQDLKIITDNVEFKLATYYSPSLKKTFIAELPAEYSGEFGPGIKALVITLYRDSNMTEPAIVRLLTTVGITISASTISRMITEGHDIFHQEKEEIISAGLKAGDFHGIDDTTCRVNGKNNYAHILCNPFFTAYFTRARKDRLTILGILCRDNLRFEINADTYKLMSQLGLREKRLNELQSMAPEGCWPREKIDQILLDLFPDPNKHKTNQRIILEAAAIVYYRNSEFAIKHLMCDDAPQFNLLALHKSLCWIHEGRHYKTLNPVTDKFSQVLEDFIDQFWDYYGELLAYKLAPNDAQAERLRAKFDVLFATKTGYDALDRRIAMTLIKKESLLMALTFPFLPLHNNAAELGARVQARARDINLQTISDNGTKSKDTFATIVQTAKKMNMNIYDYIYDRVSQKFTMPSLANLITEKAKALQKAT